ncbi:Bug family tripartite tricarboxylate transporter substrate binding protein [Roseomonas sp. BN140053]|uniref:Bug family tripartite tricarboxylate transporter substrate binding protein n=1 Tax=Roseomonas sp. BN140053 TaxID=3391898 RepID=UPI0039E786EE
MAAVLAQERLLRRSALAAGAAFFMVSPAARAQGEYPSRPLRFVTSGTPGSVSDILPRLISPEMEKLLGQPVVVENRPGGSGLVSASAVMGAPPDGYTLLIAAVGTMAVNPHVIPRMPFDPARDFQGLALIASMPLVLVVGSEAPVQDVQGLLATAKAQPGTISYGSVGAGSSANIAGAILAHGAGLELIHVPYSGYSQAVAELMAGRLSCMFVDFGTALGQIRQGGLRPLAVSTADRSDLLPDVPTMRELGHEMDVTLWYGAYVRPGAPAAASRQLGAVMTQVIRKPEIRQKLAAYGLRPGDLFGEDFQTFHLAELARWGKALPALGIQTSN